VICQNFLDYDYKNTFDAVWACASIHHLNKTDFTKVLGNIEKSLKKDGILFFCAKLGSQETVDEKGRVFLKFDENGFKDFLNETDLTKCLKIKKSYISGDCQNRPDTCWVNFIMIKDKTKDLKQNLNNSL